GPYDNNDYSSYRYANAVYNTATTLKEKGYYIYTLGFFHDLRAYELPFAHRFMNDLQNAGYYEVTDPNELEFVFGEIGEDISSDKVTPYEFKYAAPTGENYDYTATCYYSDDYFSKKANDYNPSLSTMSLCFELSAWGSNEDGQGANDSWYKNKSKNAKKLLEDIGFEKSSIEVNYYFEHKPEMDSMGAIGAYKNTTINGEKCTIITVASRGGGYEAEWAGNFDMGKSGQHTGFKTASNIIYDFLENYINTHKGKFEPKVKLWFVGYSRGAATIDLLAARLNKDLSISGVNFAQDDFYVYCFEPPMGAIQSDIRRVSPYGKSLDDNIHLIINPNDIVTKVAPRYDGFEFYRVGVDAQVIPTKATSNKYTQESANMLRFYIDLKTKNTQETVINNKHILDTFQAKRYDPILWDPHFCLGVLLCDRCKSNLINISNDNKPMNAFLDDLVKSFSYGLKNRATYVDELQQAVKIIMSSTQGKGAEDAKWQKWADIFPDKIKARSKNQLTRARKSDRIKT
ncbi:MAG: hypothetical protein FWG34_11500, partial [Oscillospiraceae bacterium]|nr:hypothetical protein [Oscillospiraceae bacterium]